MNQFLLQVKFVIVYLRIIFVKNQHQHDHLLLTIEYLLMNQEFVKQLNIKKKDYLFHIFAFIVKQQKPLGYN